MVIALFPSIILSLVLSLILTGLLNVVLNVMLVPALLIGGLLFAIGLGFIRLLRPV